MASEDAFLDVHGTLHAPHLVLEQEAEWLHHFEGQEQRPPTLWWLLMVAEGPPVALTDSMTSG